VTIVTFAIFRGIGYNYPMNAKPWDLLNPNIENVPDEIYANRIVTCYGCDNFIKMTSQCKKCGCFMNLKCKLPHASCPIGLWDVYKPE
jgi:hypothetical protein